MKVITEYIRPPVPSTKYDWMARVEDDEQAPVGYGPTEEEALKNLAELLADQVHHLTT